MSSPLEFATLTPRQVGDVLRGYRRERGLTQQQLATRLGLPQKAISSAENFPERLDLNRLFALLGALEVELVLRDKRSRPMPKVEW